LIHSVLDGLSAFEERRQNARAASESQAVQYGAVCDAVDALVRSVQFHDITRQQVEHVVESLRHVLSETSAAPASLAVILRLQRSQLLEAARLFRSSVESIATSLESIAQRVSAMAEAGKNLMGATDGNESPLEQNPTASDPSFFESMERSLAGMLELAAVCDTTESEIRSTAADLGVSVKTMQASVLDTRATEISIERIAINATIRATQIGESGTALNVVAEVMRGLALESNRTTEEAASVLESMLEAVSGMVTGLELGEAVTGGNWSDTREAARGLHSASELSFNRVAQIAALGARLAEDIAALRRDFTAGEIFDQTMQAACEGLAKLGADSGDLIEAADASEADSLEHLALGYTMQLQRDVHRSVLAGAPLAPAADELTSVTVEEAGPADDTLGENIELF
jgi:hypothetical protein